MSTFYDTIVVVSDFSSDSELFGQLVAGPEVIRLPIRTCEGGIIVTFKAKTRPKGELFNTFVDDISFIADAIAEFTISLPESTIATAD